jgi:hypothetical protein
MLKASLSAFDPKQTFSALFGHRFGEHQQVPSAELTTRSNPLGLRPRCGRFITSDKYTGQQQPPMFITKA